MFISTPKLFLAYNTVGKQTLNAVCDGDPMLLGNNKVVTVIKVIDGNILIMPAPGILFYSIFHRHLKAVGFFTISTIQVDQTNNSTTNLLSQKPPTLVEQVFNSGLFKQKDSSLMGGMSSGKVMESRLAGGRGRPIWALHDRESPVSPLNMQV